MAANAKYQAAPQRDSFEEGNYTQAPPSYQAEGSSNTHTGLGVPRQEDDNIPDDFKVLTSPESFCTQYSAYYLGTVVLTLVHSLAVPLQRRRFPSACSSFARSTPFCMDTLSEFTVSLF